MSSKEIANLFHRFISFTLVLLGFLLAGLSISFEKNWVPMYGLYSHTGFFLTLGVVIGIHFMLTFALPLLWPVVSEEMKTNLEITVNVSTFILIFSALVAVFVGVEQHQVNRILFKEKFNKNQNNFLNNIQAAENIQTLQLKLRCCGYDGPDDWQLTYKQGAKPNSAGIYFLPSSCCARELHKDFPMDVCKKEDIQYKTGCSRLVHFDQFDPVHGLILLIIVCLTFDFIAQVCINFNKSKSASDLTSNVPSPTPKQ